MGFGSTTPILRIFDEDLARAFYVGFLGFTVDWEHRFGDGFPLYMQVSRGRCVLHLSGHHGDCTPGSAARVQTTELEQFHRELVAKQKYLNPSIQEMPWGSLDMSITDPFGNRLTFTNAVTTRSGAPVAGSVFDE